MIELPREVLSDADGQPVLTFLRTTRDGLPAADRVELVDGVALPHAAAVARTAFPGWAFSAPPELGRLLLDQGAAPLRHAVVMSRDLVTDLPQARWATAAPADPALRVAAASIEADDYYDAMQAAYPPGHPDWADHPTREARVAAEITPLLDGTLGPVLSASGVVRGPDDAVVAACLVTEWPGDGPLVIDVFRRPDATYAGLGALLLRRSMALLAAEGSAVLTLAVTATNPARNTYDRLGFQPILESLTVHLPPAA